MGCLSSNSRSPIKTNNTAVQHGTNTKNQTVDRRPIQSNNANTIKTNTISTREKYKSPPKKNTNNTDDKVIYLKALFDFKARAEEDLTMMKDDLLILKDDSDKNWWFCQNKRTKAEGFVPSNYVGREKSHDLEEWFFGDIKRSDAENILLRERVKGLFLIRNAETTAGCFSLSINDGSDNIKHYRIRKMDNGNLYISSKASFPSLALLIEYYSKRSEELCCFLLKPPKKISPETFGLSKNTWEEPREHFKLTKQLGSGQFGEVWEAVYKGSTLVAVKTLKVGTMSSADFLEEANIMKKLHHPNLVQLLAVCTDGTPLYIVAEYMKNGSLLSYLKKNKSSIKQRNMIDMSLQVANGMQYLEANKFIHRDLAARNILVSHDLNYKVADFGLARITQEDLYEGSDKSKFPIKWTAPEAAISRKFTTKSDVWSFGILLYEIATYAQTPYQGMSNIETIQQITQGFRLPKPSGCAEKFYGIMLDCWHENPDKRPTFEYLTGFFEDFDSQNQKRYTDL